MLLDAQNLFSDKQEITVGTTVSANVIKFGKGEVSFLPFMAQVVENFSNIKSLTLKIETSDDENFSTPVTLAESNLPVEELKEGNVFPISRFPKGNKGYMRLIYTTDADENVLETSGKITAGATLSSLG